MVDRLLLTDLLLLPLLVLLLTRADRAVRRDEAGLPASDEDDRDDDASSDTHTLADSSRGRAADTEADTHELEDDGTRDERRVDDEVEERGEEADWREAGRGCACW